MTRRTKAELELECRHRLKVLRILCDERFPKSGPLQNLFTEPLLKIEADINSGAQPYGSILYGINEAIGDMMEALIDLSGDGLRNLDEKLTRNGCPSLSQMRSKQWRRVQKIIRRRKIDDESDYYLVVEKLSDVSTSGLTEDQRQLLEQLVGEYVQRLADAPD